MSFKEYNLAYENIYVGMSNVVYLLKPYYTRQFQNTVTSPGVYSIFSVLKKNLTTLL